MITFFGKLWRNNRGNTLAIVAACLPLFVGAAGLASDTIQWTLWKRQLQRAADSAAIAGVYSRESNGGGTTGTNAVVAHDLNLNLHTFYSLSTGRAACSGKCDITYPADSGATTDQVKVTISIQQPLSFSSLFMTSAPIITANSTAAAISTGTPCALALNSTGTAMNYSGNATVTAPTCILYSDSASSNAASAGGSSAVQARAIDAVGGIQQSNNFNVGSYGPYSPSIPDPFSGITPDPNAMNCTSSAANKNTDWAAMKASGINCFSSLSTNPSDSITVPNNFGPIYINGGSVDFKGDFSCTGCSVVLTNKSTAANATIGTWSSNSQAHNNITAQTTGTFAGIAIYQDRRATGNVDKINGGASNVLQGAIYFPKDTLWINGSGTAVSLCAMWVANNITFLGNSSIAISSPDDTACSAAGLPSGGAAKIVRLVA
jgi:predicted lipoprotein with Yx(FWY)xxD motif